MRDDLFELRLVDSLPIDKHVIDRNIVIVGKDNQPKGTRVNACAAITMALIPSSGDMPA